MSRSPFFAAFVLVLACLLAQPTWSEDQPAPAPVQAPSEAPPIELSIGGIVIEAEWLKVEPSLEEQAQEFRKALAVPDLLTPVERSFADGSVEVQTRYGKFCLRPVPDYLQASIGSGLALAARCAAF
jgi:hypothetical protein